MKTDSPKFVYWEKQGIRGNLVLKLTADGDGSYETKRRFSIEKKL